MNFRIIVAYDGTAYSGWQLQEGYPTIQGKLQEAVQVISGETVTVHGAGRTDAGVHALGQNASFKLSLDWTAEKMLAALNGNLPPDIRILKAFCVNDEFHARFSAKRKTYSYQIWNRHVMNPLFERFAWHLRSPLDLERLNSAAQLLIGRHDFTAFTTSDCETLTTIRKIDEIAIDRTADLLTLRFSGNGFLRYQVRKMTAAIAGEARSRLRAPLREILEGGKRELIPGMAPAKGLTLLDVEY